MKFDIAFSNSKHFKFEEIKMADRKGRKSQIQTKFAFVCQGVPILSILFLEGQSIQRSETGYNCT